MAIEYFCCYHSYLRKVAKLSDQELGRLFRALLVYSSTGERAQLAGREDIAFDFIADDIDRAKKAYEQRCAINANNAKNGGRPKKRPVSEKADGLEKTDGFSENRTVFNETEKNQTKDKTKGKSKSNHSLPPISPQGDNESFRAFWEAYPRKINFGKAQKAWEKLEPNTELTDIILSAVQEQSSSAQWQQEEGRFIPSPDNWLTNHCWEDKPLPAEPKRTRSYDLEEIERLSVFNLPDNL